MRSSAVNGGEKIRAHGIGIGGGVEVVEKKRMDMEAGDAMHPVPTRCDSWIGSRRSSRGERSHDRREERSGNSDDRSPLLLGLLDDCGLGREDNLITCLISLDHFIEVGEEASAGGSLWKRKEAERRWQNTAAGWEMHLGAARERMLGPEGYSHLFISYMNSLTDAVDIQESILEININIIGKNFRKIL